MIRKFRKKPVVIEAIQFDGTVGNLWEIQGAMGYKVTPFRELVTGRLWLSITTLEGEMRARPTDWIIRGVAAELYPCKDEIFKETYEEVK